MPENVKVRGSEEKGSSSDRAGKLTGYPQNHRRLPIMLWLKLESMPSPSPRTVEPTNGGSLVLSVIAPC